MISAFGVEHLAKALSPGRAVQLRRIAGGELGPDDPRKAYAFARLERSRRGQQISANVTMARSRARASARQVAGKLAAQPRPDRQLP